MKRAIILPLFVLLFASCNPDTVDVSLAGSSSRSASDNTATLNSVSDSLARIGMAFAPIEYEHLGTSDNLGVSVMVPVVASGFIEPAGLVEQFTELAKLTGGEENYVAAAREITKTFIGILDTQLVDNSDLVFMIDGTASMADDIDNVKRGITTIMKHVRMHQNIRVGVTVYRDVMDGPIWFSHLPLTTNYDSVMLYVNSITALGGGLDWEESVYDAACLTLDTMQWREQSHKMLLLLGDAPGIIGPRSAHTLQDVVVKSKEHGVDMNFYPVIITTSMPVVAETIPVVNNPLLINKVFPNPTAGDVTVDMNELNSYSWQVTDVAGGVLQENAGYTSRITLDLSGLPNGVYMIKVSHESITETKMIVVSH